MTKTKGRKRSSPTPQQAFEQIYSRQLGEMGTLLRRLLLIWIGQAKTEKDLGVLLKQCRLIPGYREHFRAEFIQLITKRS